MSSPGQAERLRRKGQIAPLLDVGWCWIRPANATGLIKLSSFLLRHIQGTSTVQTVQLTIFGTFWKVLKFPNVLGKSPDELKANQLQTVIRYAEWANTVIILLDRFWVYNGTTVWQWLSHESKIGHWDINRVKFFQAWIYFK